MGAATTASAGSGSALDGAAFSPPVPTVGTSRERSPLVWDSFWDFWTGNPNYSSFCSIFVRQRRSRCVGKILEFQWTYGLMPALMPMDTLSRHHWAI